MTPTQATAEDRHQPVRTCVGCRTRRPQAALVRFVSDDRGHLVASRIATGRGAWLCPEQTCWEQAAKRKAWSRALRRPTTVPARLDDAIRTDGFRDRAAAD